MIARVLLLLFLMVPWARPSGQQARSVAQIPSSSADHSESQSQELTLMFGQYRPPYVLHKEDRGLDVDITQTVLERMGYKIHPAYASNEKLLADLYQHRVDGAIGVTPKLDDGVCYTVPFVFYDNVAISKAKNQIRIRRVPDLKEYKFLAFQKADEYLGKEYAEIASQARQKGELVEIGDQKEQVKLFWRDQVEVVVMDLNIFRYYQKVLSPKISTRDEIVIHRIFPLASNIRAGAFWNKKVCQEFNRSLEEIKADGTYQKIIDKYMSAEAAASAAVPFETEKAHLLRDAPSI